ncbi:hypothetical protein CEXT_45771, partial [Caerostris extrusa]
TECSLDAFSGNFVSLTTYCYPLPLNLMSLQGNRAGVPSEEVQRVMGVRASQGGLPPHGEYLWNKHQNKCYCSCPRLHAVGRQLQPAMRQQPAMLLVSLSSMHTRQTMHKMKPTTFLKGGPYDFAGKMDDGYGYPQFLNKGILKQHMRKKSRFEFSLSYETNKEEVDITLIHFLALFSHPLRVFHPQLKNFLHRYVETQVVLPS